jgi:hypothetical protein
MSTNFNLRFPSFGDCVDRVSILNSIHFDGNKNPEDLATWMQWPFLDGSLPGKTYASHSGGFLEAHLSAGGTCVRLLPYDILKTTRLAESVIPASDPIRTANIGMYFASLVLHDRASQHDEAYWPCISSQICFLALFSNLSVVKEVATFIDHVTSIKSTFVLPELAICKSLLHMILFIREIDDTRLRPVQYANRSTLSDSLVRAHIIEPELDGLFFSSCTRTIAKALGD